MAYDIGTSPVISLTVWAYQRLSLLILDSNRRYIYLLEAVINVGQFASLFQIWGVADDFIINSYLAVQHWTALVGVARVLKKIFQYFFLQVRAATIANYRTRFQRYIRNIDKAYFQLLENDDPKVQGIVAKYTKRARMLTKFNFSWEYS